MSDESKKPQQKIMELLVQRVGEQIAAELEDTTTGPPMGFMLMIFDFGEGGFCAYMSNAQRRDIVRLLREQADRLEISRTN